jgi:hypothetical protein
MTSQPAGGTQPAAPDTAAPANQALAHPAPVHQVVRRTCLGGTWVGAALLAVVLLQLLIFHPGKQPERVDRAEVSQHYTLAPAPHPTALLYRRSCLLRSGAPRASPSSSRKVGGTYPRSRATEYPMAL